MCAESVRHVRGGPRGFAPLAGMSPWMRAVIVAGAIAALGVVVTMAGRLGLGVGQRPPAGDAPNELDRAKAPRKPGTEVVTAAQLLQEFRDNPAADRKYRGKCLEISGVVERSGTDGNDTPFIILHGGDEDAKLKIECFFDSAGDQDEVRIKRLRTGKTVTVRGEYEGRVSHLQIRDCVLIK
jgi:hypothetical protein